MCFNYGGVNVDKKLLRGALLETALLNLINESAEGGLHGYGIFEEIRKQLGVSLGRRLCIPN
jgi:hypothetical protein